MTTATDKEITESGGILHGPLRTPRNMAAVRAQRRPAAQTTEWRAGTRGSIHDDQTAQALGFRGGTVAGSIHMDQFPPLLLRAFGPRWFERGTLSCYFQNATVDQESVKAFVELPPPGAGAAQVRLWMDHENGTRVLEGTASVGDSMEPTMLRAKIAALPPRGETRIYQHLEVGMALAPQKTKMEPDPARIERMTEPLDWYKGDSPWGGPIASPSAVVGMMRRAEQGIGHRTPGVGLFGGIEVRHINGPVFTGREYEVSGKVLAVGETPKSEYWYYESIAREPGSDAEVAAMIMMLRMMKGSSDLWKS